MSPSIVAIIMFIVTVALIIMGCPIAFALGGTALIFGFMTLGEIIIPQFSLSIWASVTTYQFVAVGLFIFMGTLLQRSGVADRLFEGLRLAFGAIRGGLALASMVIATIFAACTGISGASVVAIGLLALPSMLKYRYSTKLATGTICAGGGLGVIIPPSVMLIIYGPTAGVSVAALFAATIIPGLILASFYLLYIGIKCYFKPELGPPMPSEERRISTREIARILAINLVPPAFLIFGVLGVIFFGIAAPTEAASIGALGALMICAGYRKLNWQTLKLSIYDSLRIISMIFYIVIGAKLFTNVFLSLGGGKLIQNSILGLELPSTGIIVVMLFINFILGMIMDWIGIILILTPTLVPIIATLGIDPLWFGVLFCITLQISYMTPPFAYSIFYLKGIAPPEVELSDIYRGSIPFVIIQLLVVGISFVFPQLSLWLPGAMK